MNGGTRFITFLLLTPWMPLGVAAQTVNFTVPLQVSGLQESIQNLIVGCKILQPDGTAVGWNEETLSVDTATGRPTKESVVIHVQSEPDKGQSATKWECSMYIYSGTGINQDGSPSLFGPKLPSNNADEALRPAPGTALVEKVSGEIPAPSVPTRNIPR